jgi:phosphatidylserine decarboxylase
LEFQHRLKKGFQSDLHCKIHVRRYFGLLAGVELPRPLGGCCVFIYSALFSCNLEEAELSSVWDYPSIGAFFTRYTVNQGHLFSAFF